MDYERLSKEISYALRHAPHEYELELDEYGWVHVEHLLYALHEQEHWKDVSERDLRTMIDRSDKKRHELDGGKIRAIYGHSTPKKIAREPAVPPDVLYHGTAAKFLSSILDGGLIPKGRQYVHLSEVRQIAWQVGKRRDDTPVILKIDAKTAFSEGVAFYHGNEMVWLADRVPAAYLTVLEE